MSTIDLRREHLQNQHALLIDQYRAVSEQRNQTLSASDRITLDRQLANLEKEIAKTELEIENLMGSQSTGLEGSSYRETSTSSSSSKIPKWFLISVVVPVVVAIIGLLGSDLAVELLRALRVPNDVAVNVELSPVPATTEEPTEESVEEPTPEPIGEPTGRPTEEPIEEPTREPTEELAQEPTARPMQESTQVPAEEPTQEPTEEPSEEPTQVPTEEPAQEPTARPMQEPTQVPTEEPIEESTQEPAEEPTLQLTTTPREEPSGDRLAAMAERLGLEQDTLRVDAKTGSIYVRVPQGEFIMGAPGPDDQEPVRTIYLDEYFIKLTEVTNAEYGQCVEEGFCVPPNNSIWDRPEYSGHPVTNVRWSDAAAFAEWVGGYLPSEAQWEKACRGTDARLYSWGTTDPSIVTANVADRFGGTTGVLTTLVDLGSEDVSPYGVRDLAGSVREWVSDWYSRSYYGQMPSYNPDGPIEPTRKHTIRGGAFDDSLLITCVVRHSAHSERLMPSGATSYTSEKVGFRVVLPITP